MGIDRVVDRLNDVDEGVLESFLNVVRNRSA
jgi:hypothetical protein